MYNLYRWKYMWYGNKKHFWEKYQNQTLHWSQTEMTNCLLKWSNSVKIWVSADPLIVPEIYLEEKVHMYQKKKKI